MLSLYLMSVTIIFWIYKIKRGIVKLPTKKLCSSIYIYKNIISVIYFLLIPPPPPYSVTNLHSWTTEATHKGFHSSLDWKWWIDRSHPELTAYRKRLRQKVHALLLLYPAQEVPTGFGFLSGVQRNIHRDGTRGERFFFLKRKM